ncbi:MAG: GGDEF domain-containing protein, partial [Gammaproteobacteria bacterium]|nr:GGDEF domain-containing protein [Gammaproteobacteria bacterium]
MNSLIVRIKLYLLLGCILLWSMAPQVLASQYSSLPLDEYFSQTWDTRDGLPHNGINALAQSQDGYLWLGTWEGLARFNGREFKVFTRGSVTGLPDSAIKSLTTSGDGHLLVAGARGGVSERLDNSWRPQLPAQALVNHAMYDQDGGLWLGLEEHGLVYRDLDTQIDTTVIADLRVYKIVQTLDLSLWVATDKGLFQVKNRTEVTHSGLEQGLPVVPIHTLLITKQQQLIVGTDLGAFKRQDNRFVILDPGLADQAILSLMQDNNSDIWLGTS